MLGAKNNSGGVKIPSKIDFNNQGKSVEVIEEKQNENKLSYGYSSGKYDSPKNIPKNNPKYDPKNVPRSVSFSGIACAFNGVDEVSSGKSAPLALYVG